MHFDTVYMVIRLTGRAPNVGWCGLSVRPHNYGAFASLQSECSAVAIPFF